MSYNKAIVIDNGSSTCKAGFAGDDTPHTVFPSIIGTPRRQGPLSNKGKDGYIAHEAVSNRQFLNIRPPVEYGFITRWDDMETIWHHVLEKELEVISSDHPILMADPLSNRNSARERTAQIVFENFNTPAFCTLPSAVLSLYASGRNTGLVIDSGSQVTDIVPVHNGFIIEDACCRSDIAGDDLTDYLWKQLTDTGYEMLTSTGGEIVRDMKEKFGYVALDYEEEFLYTLESSHSAKAYELPDGQVILVGGERISTTECLFQPCMLGLDSRPLQASVYRSIMKSDEGIQNDLFQNIVLSGGNTLFRGLPERLQKEIADFDSNKHNVSVIAPPHRKYLAWIGGSMLAAQSDFQKWISKEEYEEVGPSIVHRCI